jgi:transposase
MLDWIHDAISYFPKSPATIIRWFGETVGYFDLRTTNGVVEGINNKLKLINRLIYFSSLKAIAFLFQDFTKLSTLHS